MTTHAPLPVLIADLPPEEDPVRRLLQRHVPWVTHGDPFSAQTFGVGRWPDQGWKLHLSATPLSAPDVLARALPLLLEAGVRFKVVNTVRRLMALNGGSYGDPQVGKFVTVYPSDDAQAVRLALALDEATRGLAGPRVPTDRPLRPGSLVHYRYGAFRATRDALQRAGEEGWGVYDLLDPAGRLTTDTRLHYYQPPPPEVVDPFVAAGVYQPPPRRSGPFAGRYLIQRLLDRSVRGGVFFAIDLAARPPRPCLIKELWHDVGMDRYGRDARAWGMAEAEVLAAYADDPAVPALYDRFEQDGNLYIVLEFVEGRPVDREAMQHGGHLDGLPLADLAAIGRGAAETLRHLHAIGIVFRDFKPGNLIRTPAGDYRLIDFGLAYRYREDTRPPIATGTPPYFPQEQIDGEPPDPRDDIYAWGAVMHHLACGRRSFEGQGEGVDRIKPFPRRPVRALRPDLPESLAAVIDRAVAMRRDERYQSMGALIADLDAALAQPHAARPAAPRAPSPLPPAPGGAEELPELGEPLALARAVGDALLAAAVAKPDGLCWPARIEGVPGEVFTPDLHDGAAGIGLFLAELARASGEERYAAAAHGAARWLSGTTWGDGRARPGLHCGECGVGLLYLRLAELLDEPGYLAAAELRARRLEGVPFQTLDLLYGAAGAVLFLVRLAAATGTDGYLARARAAGETLLGAARRTAAGIYWIVPSPDPALPSLPYLGLSHGAAGIALALAELGQATGDARFLDAARAAAELLIAEAVPDGDGWQWRRNLGDPTLQLAAHCHGATGIGAFFLRLDRLLPDARYREAARRAATGAAAHMPLKMYSGLCHGIAGDAALFLDCYRAWQEPRFLALAQECGRRLQTFQDPERPGVYLHNRSGMVSPDLMNGYAGVGLLELRLADPARRPDPILP
jgi:hypothetical protein